MKVLGTVRTRLNAANAMNIKISPNTERAAPALSKATIILICSAVRPLVGAIALAPALFEVAFDAMLKTNPGMVGTSAPRG